MTVSLSAFLAVLCCVFAPVPVIRQGIESLIHLEDHIAAVAAVAAVRAAVRHIQFPAEAYMAVAAFAGPDPYFRSVCKHRVILLS